MSKSWFEEKPSDPHKDQVERAAHREIDARFETRLDSGAQGSRRSFWTDLVKGWSGVHWSAGGAGAFAVAVGAWFITRDNGDVVPGGESTTNGLLAWEQDMDFDLQPTSLDELDLVAEIELLEDYEYLEFISDSELERGDIES